MEKIKGLKCKECGNEYSQDAVHVCELCFGPLEVVYNYEVIAKELTKEKIKKGPKSLWRYKELLPINGEPTVGIFAGYTPLIRAHNLEKKLGMRELYIKNDTVNHPTLSFKDRVVAIALTKAKEFGFDTVACASTGNLANSVAAHSASAGLRSFIFIPWNLEQGKVIGSLVYSPNLIAINGNYDDVNRLCNEISGKYNWAFVNINIRPYYAEGSKTLAYETIEQLDWKAPEQAVVPIASGSLLTKIWKGLHEFEKLGFIKNMNTKIYGAQALGCSPVVTAFKQNTDIIKPVKPNTIAKSIAIGNPADGYYALKTIIESGGKAESVTDDEVVEGIKLLGNTEGIFTETAGGVTIATLQKLVNTGQLDPEASTVAYVTGNGLKTQEALEGRLSNVTQIEPHLDAFEEMMKKAKS
ncbi:MAG: threonine synthase [Candidatus Firestonebacteria bacterium]|nr:threonine synthase [Candidatus Firestonebacteria bacterium]